MSTKKESMLQDADVRRWYENNARGSLVTAEVYLRRLSLFCEQNKLAPKDLVKLGRTDRHKLEDLIQDQITKMEREGKAPGYTSGILKAVRSWLGHNEVELKRRIKVANPNATPTIEDERVPTKEELKTIIHYGSERVRASMTLISQAGLRPESLGNESGTDGLTVGDLPEMKVKDGKVEFQRIPTMVAARPTLSKAKHKYFTFLGKEGCEYLAAYLNKRLANGETFTPKTPIIAVSPGFEKMGKSPRNRGSRFITPKNISREIREAMRPMFNWRPYVLRAYFDTQMLLAESHGKITHPYRVFFMGHKGDMEARYTTNKGCLPEELVEDMRRAFKESEQYLTTTPMAEKDKKEMLLEMWREQAKLYRINPMKIRIEKEKQLKKELSPDEEKEAILGEIAKLKIFPMKTRRRTETNGNGPNDHYETKLIAENQLVPHLREGWEIVKELKSGKIVIEKEDSNI